MSLSLAGSTSALASLDRQRPFPLLLLPTYYLLWFFPTLRPTHRKQHVLPGIQIGSLLKASFTRTICFALHRMACVYALSTSTTKFNRNECVDTLLICKGVAKITTGLLKWLSQEIIELQKLLSPFPTPGLTTAPTKPPLVQPCPA
jgi:hypothetical protein